MPSHKSPATPSLKSLKTLKTLKTLKSLSSSKVIVFILALALYLPLQDKGVLYSASPLRPSILTHITFHFAHANIFHLAANLLCLYLIKFPIRYVPAFIVATLVSFLPCPTWDWSTLSFQYIPLCGLSAFLLAAVGIAWGEVSSFRKMARYTLIPVVLFSLLPHINLLIHVYALLAGFIYAKLMKCLTRMLIINF